jgi:hypothetical protein
MIWIPASAGMTNTINHPHPNPLPSREREKFVVGDERGIMKKTGLFRMGVRNKP